MLFENLENVLDWVYQSVINKQISIAITMKAQADACSS
jgi:hypothetical protein